MEVLFCMPVLYNLILLPHPIDNFLHPCSYHGTIFYRLKIIDIDGKYTYSGMIQLFVNNTIKNLIAPTIISNVIKNIYLDKPGYRAVEVVSNNGSIVAKHNITLQTGNIKIPVNQLATVVYLVRIISNATSAVEKNNYSVKKRKRIKF